MTGFALVLPAACHDLGGNGDGLDRESAAAHETESWSEAAFIPTDPLADEGPVSTLVINDTTITVDEMLMTIRDDLEAQSEALPPDRYMAYLVRKLQDRVRILARDALLYHEASKDVTEQEEDAIAGFVDQQVRDRINREFGGRQTRYERALADEGRSSDDDRERMRREMLIARWLQQSIVRKISDPTRDELWSFYLIQKDSLAKPPRRDMRLIEISILAELPAGVNTPTPEQLRTARAAAEMKAAEARDLILNGTGFAEVAAEYSKGLYAKSGGEWGWVTRDGVRERWLPAVDALFQLTEAGLPSEVIETQEAFFIVQAAAIDLGSTPEFESVQIELMEQYRDSRFNALVEEEIARLHDQAHIQPPNIGRFLRAVAIAAPQPIGATTVGQP
jgi:hypothetical protein